MEGTIHSGEKRRREGCPEEAAFLELLLTTDMLSRRLVKVLKAEDLSATQYNVLRILRGSPAGLPCGEIASRMIRCHPAARPSGEARLDLEKPRNQGPADSRGPNNARWINPGHPAR
jgi:hypothetical protein